MDENPLLTAKMLAQLLNLPYKKYRQTLTNYRNFWVYNHENERGSKCSDFHCFKAKARFDRQVSDSLRVKLVFGVAGAFVGFGWRLSKSRNRFLDWRGKLGRVVWFETGSVRVFVKKPGNLGKAKQLFCDAFVNSGLLSDMAVLNSVLEKIRPRSGHFAYKTGQRLPGIVIRDFEESHGIVIKIGDRSHPNAVEVIASFSAAVEKALDKIDNLEKSGEALERISGVLSKLGNLDDPKAAEFLGEKQRKLGEYVR